MHKQVYTYGLLSLILLISTGAHASLMKIKESSLHARGLENVELFHDDNEGFSLKHNGIEHLINKHSVSPELRSITSAKLAKYQDAAFLSLVKQSDGEFSLKSHVRGEAGGPLLGYAVYWTTKAVCYAVPVVAAGGFALTTGGIGGAVTGGLVAGATSTISAGTGVAAGVLAGAGLSAETAGAITAAVVTNPGGVVGTMAAIESLALWLGGAAACLPGI